MMLDLEFRTPQCALYASGGRWLGDAPTRCTRSSSRHVPRRRSLVEVGGYEWTSRSPRLCYPHHPFVIPSNFRVVLVTASVLLSPSSLLARYLSRRPLFDHCNLISTFPIALPRHANGYTTAHEQTTPSVHVFLRVEHQRQGEARDVGRHPLAYSGRLHAEVSPEDGRSCSGLHVRSTGLQVRNRDVRMESSVGCSRE